MKHLFYARHWPLIKVEMFFSFMSTVEMGEIDKESDDYTDTWKILWFEMNGQLQVALERSLIQLDE